MSEQRFLEIYEQAKSENDQETAIRALESLKSFRGQQQPERGLGEKILGVAETAGTLASGFVAEPAAGIAAIPFQATESLGITEPGGAAAVVEGVREAATYQPRTEAGQEYVTGVAETLEPVTQAISAAETGLGRGAQDLGASPAVATAAHLLPTAAMEASGVGLLKGAAMAPGRVAKNLAKKGKALEGEYQDFIAPEQKLEGAAQIISEGDPEKIAINVQADPDFYKAADELGFDTEPLSAFASQNPQYRQVEMGLASMPGSSLDAQSKAFIMEASQKADNLIEEYGGTTDKAALSMEFRQDALDTIDNIYGQEDVLYTSISDTIGPREMFTPDNTLSHLEELVADSGGIEMVDKPIAALYTQMKKDGGVTNSFFDKQRRQTGRALKNQGPFADADIGELKQLLRGNEGRPKRTSKS